MNSRKLNILLIEDDEIDIESTKRALTKNNIVYTLNTANNGLEALELLDQCLNVNTLPDIILLDINMPKMSGLDFLKTVRKKPEYSSILIFMLTSSNHETDILAAYQQNIAGYLLKPVDFGVFTQSMKCLNDYWSIIEMPHGKISV